MLAVAVIGHGARLGGKGDQRLGGRRFDARQTTFDGPAGHPSFHGAAERVVAAGVEQDQLEPLDTIERVQHPLERYGLVFDVEVAQQSRIDRDEVVHAVDFDTVSRIIHDGDVGVPRRLGKLAQRPAQIRDAEIGLMFNRREASLLQQCADRIRVARRVGQPGNLLVLRHSNDKRNPLFGQCRAREQQAQKTQNQGQGPHQILRVEKSMAMVAGRQQ